MAIDIEEIYGRLESICTRALQLETRFAAELDGVHTEFHDSARNLVHYLALRHDDIRDLQEQLTSLGVSSLGRAEPHVMASIQVVQKALRSIEGAGQNEFSSDQQIFEQSRQRAEKHTRDLLGSNPGSRGIGIMVTMPGEAAHDYQLVYDLVVTGMDVARINCAHDTESAWLGMIENIRRANEQAAKNCKIVMDLAGPKLRTGQLVPGPRVLRIRPRRDAAGQVISPKRIRFIADDTPWPGKKVAVLPVPGQCIDYAEPGDEIRFRDTRGRKRELYVISKDKHGLILESYKRAYIAAGTKIRLIRKETGERLKFRVGELPAVDQPIILHIDDTLVLEKGDKPGEPAKTDTDGSVLKPAHVTCRPAEIFQHVMVGATVRLNDGKIEGTVESVSDDKLVVRITQAKPSGSRLRGNRSINFPDSDILCDGLTSSDVENLGFAVKYADAIGLSFVDNPGHVIALQDEIQKHPGCRLGIILKIETEQGFHQLPEILLAAMRSYPTGIMIARGDLAVECGWVRLAEIQEEMLWLCEAAHLPVIWATQVLERETKKGRPTRAEITDAAMSQRADCVMLNKGPHILAAIRMLDDILRRMNHHQHKKTARLRKLSVTEL